jgi:hypothetical protein
MPVAGLMISLHLISPQNEARVAERLVRQIGRLWPDVAASKTERIDVLVGVRTPMDIDIVVTIDLATPCRIPPVRRRDGTTSPEGQVQCALLAIEIKQLDSLGFERTGNQIFAKYRGRTASRSVASQADDAAKSLKAFALKSGYPRLFVHALAWLTEVDERELAGIGSSILGCEAGWFELLDAAAQQHEVLYEAGDERTRTGVRAVRDLLLNRRAVSSRDKIRSERLARDIAGKHIVRELAAQAGSKLIRLAGRGGSGKTTALALLAGELATMRAERVLVLTFHRALRGDIEHLLRTLLDQPALIGTRVHVETMTEFLLAALTALELEIPLTAEGAIAFPKLDDALREATAKLAGGPDGEWANLLRDSDPARFAWDHVFIDEAQDWTDAERDFLLRLFGHRRIVLADGIDQLVRRQTPCDWLTGIPRAELTQRILGDSLRMLRNVALFANAVADAAGFERWNVEPRDDLPGGRIVVVAGENVASPELVRAIAAAAREGKADPVDCLVCVPHSNIVREGAGRRHARFAETIAAAGGRAWDASDSGTRGTSPADADLWRIVQYDSCRGLEGWIVLALDLDDFYANRLRHPNFHPGEPLGDPETVARRWLLIPLTRAVHTLVVTIRDPQSPVAAILRAATEKMPRGVVVWTDAAECPAEITGARTDVAKACD